jgi:hypothetical protein
MNKPSIYIAVPNAGTIEIDTIKSINNLLGVSWAKFKFFECVNKSGMLGRTRNFLAKNLKDKCDYLLFVDSDSIFEPDTIKKALDANKEIVGVSYPMKEYPNIQVCGTWTNNTLGRVERSDWVKTDSCKDEFGILDWVGAGILLVNTDALKKIEYPWFRNGIIYTDEGNEEYQEDIGFCINAKKCGCEINVLTTNKTKHRRDGMNEIELKAAIYTDMEKIEYLKARVKSLQEKLYECRKAQAELPKLNSKETTDA